MTGESNTPGERVEVTSWSDIDGVTSRISEREKQLVKSALNAGLTDGNAIIWLPSFINDKETPTIPGAERLYECVVEEHSDDAYAATHPDIDKTEYVPVSWTVVFEPGGDDSTELEITSAQTGLTGFEQ